MNTGANYRRKFIILKTQYSNMKELEQKGHGKLEKRGQNININFNIQGAESTNYYDILLIGKNKAHRIGSIYTEENRRGNAEFRLLEKDLESWGFPLRKINGVLIIRNSNILLTGYFQEDDKTIEKYISSMERDQTSQDQLASYPREELEVQDGQKAGDQELDQAALEREVQADPLGGEVGTQEVVEAEDNQYQGELADQDSQDQEIIVDQEADGGQIRQRKTLPGDRLLGKEDLEKIEKEQKIEEDQEIPEDQGIESQEEIGKGKRVPEGQEMGEVEYPLDKEGLGQKEGPAAEGGLAGEDLLEKAGLEDKMERTTIDGQEYYGLDVGDIISTEEYSEALEEVFPEGQYPEPDFYENFHIAGNLDNMDNTLEYILNILNYFPYLEPFRMELKGYSWWKIDVEDVEKDQSFLPYFEYILNRDHDNLLVENHITSSQLINKYKHYIFGLYENKDGVKLYIYGIPGLFKQEEYPQAGTTGFNTWFEGRELPGYWLLFLEARSGRILYPINPMIPME